MVILIKSCNFSYFIQFHNDLCNFIQLDDDFNDFNSIEWLFYWFDYNWMIIVKILPCWLISLVVLFTRRVYWRTCHAARRTRWTDLACSRCRRSTPTSALAARRYSTTCWPVAEQHAAGPWHRSCRAPTRSAHASPSPSEEAPPRSPLMTTTNSLKSISLTARYTPSPPSLTEYQYISSFLFRYYFSSSSRSIISSCQWLVLYIVNI